VVKSFLDRVAHINFSWHDQLALLNELAAYRDELSTLKFNSVKFGSDVCYEFLELLPRLAPGIWVHVHDIFFPHDYPAEWLIERRMALNEQYLLEAFLSFNKQFQVALANYWLCLDHRDEAARVWPSNSGASSLWMKRVA
jgi:hypothetical protein